MNKIYLNTREEYVKADEAFGKFLRMKKRNNLSPETIHYYNDCFRYFGEFFPFHKVAIKLRKIHILIILNFCKQIKRRTQLQSTAI